MTEPLWQLLRDGAANLTCDECFAIMEYYAELLAERGDALLPAVKVHLEGCPSCRMEHRAALLRLLKEQELEAHPAYKKEASVAQRERNRE